MEAKIAKNRRRGDPKSPKITKKKWTFDDWLFQALPGHRENQKNVQKGMNNLGEDAKPSLRNCTFGPREETLGR